MEKEAIKGPIVLSDDCERVTDADEEVMSSINSSTELNEVMSNLSVIQIFVLYSELLRNRGSDNPYDFRGLGYVDSHKDVLELKFELKGVIAPAAASGSPSVGSHKRHKPQKVTQKLDKTIEIELLQDKTSLRTRKGDTGSVVWKASIDFAQLVLQQYYSGSASGIFSRDILHSQNILELGAGTGLLSIALSPLVHQYIATDIGPLIPLIKKNVCLNFPGWPTNPPSEKGSNVSVEELDWIAVESASVSQKREIFDTEARPLDLLLVVDCLYHPSLIPPFLATVDYLTTSEKTAVLVVSELRAEDVMRDFLEGWLSKPGWQIWRIPNGDLGRNYVIWLGWKTQTEER